MRPYDRLAEEEDQTLTLTGLLIHRARMYRRVTRAQLGRKVGMKASRIREIEKGLGQALRVFDLERIAKALAMTIQMKVETPAIRPVVEPPEAPDAS